MKKCALFVTAFSALALCALPAAAAKPDKTPKKPAPERGKPVHIKLKLVPDPALTDLGTARGKLDYQSKKHRALKVRLLVPATAPSLGISDQATAQSAVIHLELSRAGIVYDDCTLAFNVPDSEDELATPAPPTSFTYALHVKTNGKREVKGSCASGLVPTLQKGDSVTGYALVAGAEAPTRVNFIAN